MATETVGAESISANITLKDIRQVAGARRRLNESDSAPVLTVEDRQQIFEAKAVCWNVVGYAVEALVSLMDSVAGDPDLKNDTDAEDAFEDHDSRLNDPGPGCPVADIDKGVDDDPTEDDDPGEDSNDAELETWSHPDDHPAELFIGTKPSGEELPC